MLGRNRPFEVVLQNFIYWLFELGANCEYHTSIYFNVLREILEMFCKVGAAVALEMVKPPYGNYSS